jgi:exosortase
VQVTASNSPLSRGSLLPWKWLLPAALGAWAAAPIGASLLELWQRDPSFSHGPLIPIITAGLLWQRRKCLREWNHASGWGLASLVAAALLFIAAVWADIYFLKPLALIGMAAGVVWFLGGSRTLRYALGALGFLVFMIPWPTTLTERLAFPLQMTSSAYAAMLGGIIGLPIQRDGIHLHVVPNPEAAPVYSIIVARQCSGLTSLVVLLALGYLVAYHTPVRLGWKGLLLAAVIPLTLLANSLRLTAILAAGAYQSAELAKWVHDHEAPVLVLLCSLGLLGLRHALLAWLNRVPDEDGDPDGEIATPLPATGA